MITKNNRVARRNRTQEAIGEGYAIVDDFSVEEVDIEINLDDSKEASLIKKKLTDKLDEFMFPWSFPDTIRANEN